MTDKSNVVKNKFKAIELGIFTVVSLIFLNSVYHLFTDGRFLTSSERKPVAEAEKTVRGPSPASVTDAAPSPSSPAAFVPYETKCQAQESFETAATKIRITGAFCGQPMRGPAAVEAAEFKIENTTTHFNATVLSDNQARTFSTDFIPLDTGANKVMMEFKYKNGRAVPVELNINRK